MKNFVLILILLLVACSNKQNLSTDSKMIVTLNKVGQAAERAKRYEYAVSVYKEAHKLEPDNVDVIQHLAKNLSLLHQYDKVSSICKIGLKVDPANIKLIENLSASLIAQGRWSSSVYWVERNLYLTNASSVTALNSLSLILDSLKYHIKAQNCYKKSFKLDNQNKQTLNNYGLSLALNNDIAKATEYLLAANSLGDSRVSLANIKLIKKIQKEHNKVGKYLQKELFPINNHMPKFYLQKVLNLYKTYCKNP